MPKIGAQFDFKSSKANFSRDQFDTISDMTQCTGTDVDQGHISYCKETKSHYTFDKDGRHRIDPILGMWSKFDANDNDPISLAEYLALEEIENRLYFIINSKQELLRIYYGPFLIGKKAEDGQHVSVGFPMPIPFIFA